MVKWSSPGHLGGIVVAFPEFLFNWPEFRSSFRVELLLCTDDKLIK